MLRSDSIQTRFPRLGFSLYLSNRLQDSALSRPDTSLHTVSLCLAHRKEPSYLVT